MTWRLVFTTAARRDARHLAAAGLKGRTQALLDILAKNPFDSPPRFEKLVADLSGAYSRRITVQHRLVYEVRESEHVVKVLRMWPHYE